MLFAKEFDVCVVGWKKYYKRSLNMEMDVSVLSREKYLVCRFQNVEVNFDAQGLHV